MRPRCTSSSRPSSWSTLSLLALLLLVSGCGNNYTFTGDHTNKNDYALSITPAAPIVTVGHSMQLTAMERTRRALSHFAPPSSRCGRTMFGIPQRPR